jgi:hypothetical protein
MARPVLSRLLCPSGQVRLKKLLLFFFLFLYYHYSNYDISSYSLILDLLLATDFIDSTQFLHFHAIFLAALFLAHLCYFLAVLADLIYTSFLPTITTIKIKTFQQKYPSISGLIA